MSYLRQIHIAGQHNHEARVDFVGKLGVVQPYRTHGTTFVGNTIDTNFWTAAAANGGSNTQTDANLALASSVTAAGRATTRSVRSGRFIFFNPMVCRIALQLPSATAADNTRYWGVFTDSSGVPQSGFYFEQSAAGVLSVHAVDVTSQVLNVSSGSFNGDAGATYVLDTNVHAFEIHYFVMHVEFHIDGVLIHSFTPTTVKMTPTLSLPINFVTINGATGGVSGVINVWSANVVRLGLAETQPRSYMQVGTTTGVILKRGAGDLHSLTISNVTVNAVVTLYDGLTAGGTLLWASGTMAANTQPFNIDLHQVPFDTGLFFTVTGAACNLLLIYE